MIYENLYLLLLSSRMNFFFTFILTFTLLYCVTGFKNGSPAHVCLSPYPHHKPSKYELNILPQPLETAPVNVTLSSNMYGSNKTPIKILIHNIGESYKGLLMMVRSTVPVTQVPIGEFTNCNFTGIKFLRTESNRTNCLTHKDNGIKPTSIVCTWQPPVLENYGKLELTLSVVHSYSKFWVDLKYPIYYDNVVKLPYNYESYMMPPKVLGITPSSAVDINTLNSEPSINSNKKLTAFSTTKCGIDRHCLLYPPNCHLTSICEYMVSIEDLGPRGVAFELVAPLEGYFGFGISPFSRRAHQALVTICRTNKKTKVVSFTSGNTRKTNLFEELKKWITDREVGVDLNWMGKVAKVCKYTVTQKEMVFKSKTDTLKVYFTDDLHYYFAAGSMFGATEYIVGHTQNPLKSQGKINLLNSAYSIHYMSAFELGEKFHATFMILAWVLLIPIGTMIPRYFKGTWTTSYLQKVLWLLSHMVTMISGVLLSVIAYILILVINQGWRKVATIHGVFGTLTICAGLINIIIGLNRPDPKSEHRPLFNNVHFIVAAVSKMFSYITFWMILLTWGMRTNFIIVSCVINFIWNLVELLFYGLGFIYLKDKTQLKIFQNKQFSPPRWFLLCYLILECLVAFAHITSVWVN